MTDTAPAVGVAAAPAALAPGQFRLRAGVPILPATSQLIKMTDDDGSPKLDEQGKQRIAKVHFTPDKLQRIADALNFQGRRGKFPILQFGHTKLGEPDEKKQPEPVGYSQNFRVGHLVDEAGLISDPVPHLICDEQIATDRYDEAMTYPGRSPEMIVDTKNPGLTRIDRVACLRRPPKHHMSLVMNARAGAEPAAIEFDVPDEPESDTNPAPPDGDTRAPEGEEETMADTAAVQTTAGNDDVMSMLSQIMERQDTFAHALDALLASHEALHPGDTEPEPEPEPGEGEGDQSVVQNDGGMSPSTQTFAPGLNGVGKEDKTVAQNCGADMSTVQNARAGVASGIEERLSRLEAENKRFRAENAQLLTIAQEQAAEISVLNEQTGEMILHNERNGLAVEVDKLVDEGVKLDRDKELDRLCRLQPDEQKAEVDRIRVHYQRDSARRPFVATAVPKGKQEIDTSEDAKHKSLAYARKHGVTFSQALKEVSAGKV